MKKRKPTIADLIDYLNQFDENQPISLTNDAPWDGDTDVCLQFFFEDWPIGDEV